MVKNLILLLLLPMCVVAQKTQRLQPGKMYDAGESLYAPRLGVHAVVPSGWSGVFPRESEVFLLSSLTAPVEIFVFGRESGDVNSLKTAWEAGLDLDNSIRLKANSPTIQDGILSSEVVTVGPNVDKSKKGYAATKCSEFGPCVTCLAVMPVQQYAMAKKAVDEFMRAVTFDKPSNASPYATFDWKEFLAGKMFTAYAVENAGSKETTVSFCGDGSFKANATKKGIMKNQNPDYRGNLSGTWAAEGIGESGQVVLTFKKKNLAPLTIQLQIHDEKVMANGDRYFVAEANCK